MTRRWPIAKLGELCEIQRGGSPRPIDQFITESPEGINWIKIGDVGEGEKYIFSTQQKIRPEGAQRSRFVKSGDFLLTNSMSFGRPYILRTSGCIHDGWLVLRYDNERLSEDYLYHALSSGAVYSQFVKLASGAVVKNLNSDVVKGVEIPLPPLTEQRRIAAILDKAEALRAKRREALSQLDRLAQSIFVKMFGDPVTNPNGWERKPLADVCQAINDCPHSTPEWTDSGYICLRTSNLTRGDWDWSDKRFVSEATFHDRSKRGYIQAGDIVLSREGTVGIAAIVQPGMTVCMGQRLVQVRCDDMWLAPEYLLHQLLHVLEPSRISRLMVGSTAQHLNVKELKSLTTPVPPLELQREFATRIQSINSLQTRHFESAYAVEEVFKSLQHRAFRGEL